LLLTYADLNAVAPGVWSEWKSTFVVELYPARPYRVDRDRRSSDEIAKPGDSRNT